jgi:hypothetical protein
MDVDGEEWLLIAATEWESNRFRDVRVANWGIKISRCPVGHRDPSTRLSAMWSSDEVPAPCVVAVVRTRR